MTTAKTNPFGDVRAENDHEMLDKAFYETPEYRSILEEHKRRVVVGRRGTGKSALFYKLQRQWASTERLTVVILAPTDAEVIGLRHFAGLFGNKYSYLRSACSVAWQYAILNEVLFELGDHYKLRGDREIARGFATASAWRRRGNTVSTRLYHALNEKVDQTVPVEKRVATLADTLNIDSLVQLAQTILETTKSKLHIACDRLDDGYEPDVVGVAILTGLIYACDRLVATLPNSATTIFIRDNIFRAVQAHDPDYSRNIEGDVLRLHWDEQTLFYMICNRIRAAFNIEQEKDIRAWDRITSRDLTGMDGFRRCLKLTLYRPRDLLVLMNIAFNHAISHKRDTIIDEDVEASAYEISCSRLDDLKKEYREIIPGIDRLIGAFVGGSMQITLEDVENIVQPIFQLPDLKPAEGQTLALMKSPSEIVHCLFSVGFLGLWKVEDSTYVFCHDGKDPYFAVDKTSRLLVHPREFT